MRIWRRKLHYWDVSAEESGEVEIKAEPDGEGALKQDDKVAHSSIDSSANLFGYGTEDVHVKEEAIDNVYDDVNTGPSALQSNQNIGDEMKMESDVIKMEQEAPVVATESTPRDKMSVESMGAGLEGLENISSTINCCCEIICRDNDCRQYAVTLQASLQQRGIHSRIVFASVNLVDVDALMTQAECDGRLYVVLINKEDADRQTLSLAFLTGMKQRCRNLPMSDAVDFLSKDFLSFPMSSKNNSVTVGEGNHVRSFSEETTISLDNTRERVEMDDSTSNRHSVDMNTASILTRNEYLNPREFLKRNSWQASV